MRGILACTAATMLLFASQAQAGHRCSRAKPCDEHQYIEKTVMLPEWSTEKRTIQVTECKEEVRERTCTVYRRVAETKQVTQEYTVYEHEQKTRAEKYTVCKPVWETQTKEYTVMVPHQEKRQGTRKVCKLVPVTEKRTVCEDQGHWEERAVAHDCHPRKCNPCKVETCRVWVPKIVKKEVEVTCMHRKIVEEPCEYTVTVCKPEKRTKDVKVCRYVQEEKTREVCYTVCVPKKKTRTCDVVTYKCVPEQKVEKYTVLVPHTVEKEVDVKVCKMVATKVQCRVRVHCCHRCHDKKRCCA